MRIAHLIAPAAVPGGAEQVVLLGAEAQQRHHDVTVFSLTARPGLDDAFVAAAVARGIRVERLATTGVFDAAPRKILQAFAVGADDGILHAHGGRALGIARLVRRWPVVATIHGFITPTLRARLMAHAERLLAARCAAVVAVSASLEALLLRSGAPPGRLFRVDNPVRLATAPSPSSRASSTPPRLLMLSRLSHEKGVDVAIRAIARVPGVTLDIGGDGPERAALQRLIDGLGVSTRVRLCGHLVEVGPALAACDGLVLSSRQEGQPLAVLEALAGGVPVVASDVGDVGDILGNSGAGLLVRPGDVAGLAAAIERLVRCRALYFAAARAWAPVVVARHAPSAWARAMELVYACAVEGPAPVALPPASKGAAA
jgi:glycosyltransferase involved in cell wall biosynthesis